MAVVLKQEMTVCCCLCGEGTGTVLFRIAGEAVPKYAHESCVLAYNKQLDEYTVGQPFLSLSSKWHGGIYYSSGESCTKPASEGNRDEGDYARYKLDRRED